MGSLKLAKAMASSNNKIDPINLDTSVFEVRTLDDIIEEIQETYLADNRPWVIGYSGGKDSTTTLQLIWSAMEDLDEGQRTKSIYVISSDTLVETPKIVNHISSTLERINVHSDRQNLPFEAHKVYPNVDDTFWVNLIGRGYPAPNQTFRWCTDRMKIDPADDFIENKVSEHGEVIVVLGSRKAESATREQVMNLHSIDGSNLSRHSKFANAFVFTPIEDWLADDVWDYLLNTENPWGKDNSDLAALYRQADDECPMVIDTSTPSCGNSRFGCWTCTVVTEDKAMENMVDSGESWMKPLLDFRNLLKSTQDPEVKPVYREMKGRAYGKVKEKTNGGTGIIPRQYKLQFRKHLLQKLLETENEVNELRDDDEEYLELIREEELREIRRIWRTEEADWEDSVPKIHAEVKGEDMEWESDDLGSFSAAEADILQEVGEEFNVSSQLLKRLFDTELQHLGMKRRASIYDEIDKIFREDWRSVEEVAEEIEGENPDRWEYNLDYEDLNA